jgi:hypothetical protein
MVQEGIRCLMEAGWSSEIGVFPCPITLLHLLATSYFVRVALLLCPALCDWDVGEAMSILASSLLGRREE